MTTETEYEAIRDAWRKWLTDNGDAVIHAVREGVEIAVGGAFPEAGYVVDAIREGVMASAPHPSAIRDGVENGVRAAMPKPDLIIDALRDAWRRT